VFLVVPDTAFLSVSAKDAKIVVPPWYRPGYPESVRGAAWNRLRPKFKRFLERNYSRGEFKVYRPEPLWVVAHTPGAKIYQEAPPPLPDEGELVLNDPEPAEALTENLSFLERLGDRPLLFASLVAITTVGLMRLFKQ